MDLLTIHRFRQLINYQSSNQSIFMFNYENQINTQLRLRDFLKNVDIFAFQLVKLRLDLS